MSLSKIQSGLLDTNIAIDGDLSVDGNLNLDAGYGSTAPVYGVRAWVNFDGTTNVSGNCTIRASGNVSSVADNATGKYTVNFANSMPDGNYSATVSQMPHNYTVATRTVFIHINEISTYPTGSISIEAGSIANGSTTGVLVDVPVISVAVHR